MHKIKKISTEHPFYPKELLKIKNPPKEIYYKGTLMENEICLAIVGTRKWTTYGKQVALEFASVLSKAGITIVSGLAPGIDTFAHLACVEENKRTIAVLGTGLDEKSFYPKENLKLAKKIVESGGCLISEYPPGTYGTRFTFPQRNRIISGLSKGVLVIEAGEKSGALITAEYAFSQKKTVFAIPGTIYSRTSKGTNFLIKKGAKLVDNPQEILQELNLSQKIENKNFIDNRNFEEKTILEILNKGAFHIDEIIKKSKLDPSIVAKTLITLEIEGVVRNLGGNIYSLRT